ncbi:winged helix-turn-helix domain-containing protein [Ideonella sp. 4Y11]|uniref:Winged helix-turn-helix domain-containing protein n=1 Tax=Ideonella aquatica TaxID=2824119 RepID=A0A940YLX3_9BURK|nr:winged helix-turn-helix domain-containing protein [Ideonella aquatica]MBQ0958756.1 winged helix-turn-helix domain-containing protein [Ideonella aquatica]
MSIPLVLRFSGFEWHGAEQRLAREGQPLELGSRAFELLGLLASRAGQVVSKEEAFAHVWPGRVVEENNLQVQVSTLRRLLGRDAIATVPGRGYRFTWSVTTVAAGAPAALAPPPIRGASAPGAPPLLFGRDDDLSQLHAALGRHRLVTLVGEGGIGKTRLALALLAQAREQGRANWVDLSGLAEAGGLPGAVAAGLALRLPAGSSADEALLAEWPSGPQLLVLDNCEHLAPAVGALLVRLLAHDPDLRVLATSQVRLNLAAEHLHRLAPLACPEASGLAAAERSPAVQLLVQRVREHQGSFTLEPGNADALGALCRQLDGLALAIELAASQVARLGLPAVCQRLGQRLRLLTGGPLDRPERHRTLSATLDWSHGLLGDTERGVFRRLAVFQGGFDLAACLAVVGDAQIDDWCVTEALASLVDHCLVALAPGAGSDGGPRYRLLESTRAYAASLCTAAGERVAVGLRHAQWMHGRFEQAFEELGTRSDTGWREAFGPDLDNLRAALHFCLVERQAPELGIGLAGWSADLWPLLSLLDEGRRLLALAQAQLTPQTEPRAAAALWDGTGYLWQDADPRRALEARLQAEALWRQAGDRRWVRSVLGQAWNRLYLDQLAASEQALNDTALAVEASLHLKALHRTTLGALRQRQDRHAEALAAYEEALALRRRQGDARRVLIMLLNLGDLACSSGDTEAAVRWGREAEAEALRQDDPALLGVILGNLCTALLFAGRPDEAEDCARRAAPLLRHSDGLIYFVDSLAWLTAQRGRLPQAAHLLGCADAGLAARGVVRQPAEQRVVDILLTTLSAGAETTSISAWRQAGATWSDAEVLACALP